jgi:mRNA interferase MazF
MKRVLTGEIYAADLEPVRGSEQAGGRPVVVFQNPSLAHFTSTALCIPLTSNMKRLGLPGNCAIQRGEGGLLQDSVALAFQMRALDVSRLAKHIGRVSSDTIRDLGEAVLNALGIDIAAEPPVKS